MSFSWAETITAKVTKRKLSHLTELRTNINTDRSNTGLGAYSWATSPAVKDQVLAAHFLELRTALDASYDNNYCHSYYSGNLSAQHASNYSYCSATNSYYGGNYGGYYCKGKV